MRFAGVVIGKAVQQFIERGRLAAAHLLGADPANVRFAEGRFVADAPGNGIALFELARLVTSTPDLPADLRGPLKGESQEFFKDAGYPYGSQVCEVEIDPETGEVRVEAVSAVDDVGRAINPMILHGQTHGGACMGIGQALMERINYDPDTGQLTTGSYQDYAMPRAADMPFFRVEVSEVPSPTNPLGIRAGGEGGTTPALAAAVNAVVDALSDYGVTHMEMPVTADSVWKITRQARD